MPAKQRQLTGKIVWVENNFTPEVQAAYLAEASRVLFEIILPMADKEVDDLETDGCGY